MDHDRINSQAAKAQNDPVEFQSIFDELLPVRVKYIAAFSKKYGFTIDHEEIISIVNFQLWQACIDYDPILSNFVNRYFTLCKRGIQAYLRSPRNNKRNLLMGNIGRDSDFNKEVVDNCDYYDSALNKTYISELSRKNLTEKQSIALKEYYSGKTMDKIAQEYPHIFNGYKSVERTLKSIAKLAAS